MLCHDPRGSLQRLGKRFNSASYYLTLHSFTENRQMNTPCIVCNRVYDKILDFDWFIKALISGVIKCSCRFKNPFLIEHTRMDGDSQQPMKIKHDMPLAKVVVRASQSK